MVDLKIRLRYWNGSSADEEYGGVGQMELPEDLSTGLEWIRQTQRRTGSQRKVKGIRYIASPLAAHKEWQFVN